MDQIAEADAIRWRQDKSFAVAELKRLPGVKQLAPARFQLPSKQVVNVDATDTAEIERVAEAERHRHQKHGKRPRGRTTTPEERRTAKSLSAAMSKLGCRAAVKCVATAPGKPSDIEMRFSIAHAATLIDRLRA